jgi:hypothetical protein
MQPFSEEITTSEAAKKDVRLFVKDVPKRGSTGRFFKMMVCLLFGLHLNEQDLGRSLFLTKLEN